MVGCELAQAWRRLGSEVVLLVRGPRLLARLEPFAGERVAEALRPRAWTSGWTPRSTPSLPRRDAIALSIGDETIVVDELLVATGRRPNTADLGLETVGLEPGRALAVDDSGLVAASTGSGSTPRATSPAGRH